jgi:hypothetical protein
LKSLRQGAGKVMSGNEVGIESTPEQIARHLIIHVYGCAGVPDIEKLGAVWPLEREPPADRTPG